ncbi:hypothetical protein Tco_1363711, partial [Tanacetum coccineum]
SKPAPVKPKKPAPAKQSKQTPLRLVDEEEEIQQEPESQGESEDSDVERAIKLSLDSSQARGEGEGKDYDYERAIKMSLDSFQAQPDLDEDQAGSDPGKADESRSTPGHDKVGENQAGPDPRKGHEALAGSNPEPMNEEFYAAVYPKVHENLKLRTNEHVILENPPSTTKTPKTILALPPPPPTQSSTNYELAARVADLKKRNAELECVFTIQNKTTNNLASKIFTLEHHDLEYRIDNYIRDVWMFKSGSHMTHPDHENLYEALDRSIARDNQDELHEAVFRSRKRRCDDQDPPPPSPP